ncbi:MAG TPA: DUF3626 domain-containing protein, partial [Baekduia sp.]|nr:DUF3626 domain-containing protein [Baekduia sp.]
GLTAYPGGDRWRWESRMFGGAYDEAPPSARPRYGALNHRRRARGAAPRFGSAHLRLAEAALDRTFVLGPPASGGGSDAIAAVATAPAIALVVVWAAAAAALPLLVRGRLLVLDAVAALAWAAALAAASQAAIGAQPRGLIAGALAAAALAVAPRSSLRVGEPR